MNLNALAARCARRASGFALIESPDCYPAPAPAHLVRSPRDLDSPRVLRPALGLRRPYQQTQIVWQGRFGVPVYVRQRRYADAFLAHTGC